MVIKQKIIEQLKKRDEQAFEYVYNLTKKGVYIVIYNILKDHSMTQDIMQDAYLKMLDKIDQYQVKTNFYNWLLMISKNLALDTYRREQKLVHYDEVDYDEVLTSHEETPDQKDQFNRLLSVLTDEEKEIVLLRIVEDMKHKDIAKIVDKPTGTVTWLYQQALDKMKKVRG
jgi:RNA polymerase sigma-70 factor (ECF subfamily)